MKDPARFSVVYSLEEALREGSSLGEPEPDYLKWLEPLMCAETGTAADEADYDGNSAEDREGWRIFCEAAGATHELLKLSQRNHPLFQKIARHFSVLPCLLSRHPAAKGFNAQLFAASQLGKESILGEQARHSQHYAHQSWPVRYAYALMTTIDLSLDTWEDQLPLFGKIYGYGVKHPIGSGEFEMILAKGQRSEEENEAMRRKYRDAYRILPNWTKGMETGWRRFSRDSVLGYWRKGKEIMLEEMPDFHLRPEWKNYHDRRYNDGAKAGVIQHAIFKDILAALKTIAGGDSAAKRTPRKSNKGSE